MRVIEERYIHERQAFCIHCGATIGYYPVDIKTKYVSDRIYEFIKCPCCGTHIIFKIKN